MVNALEILVYEVRNGVGIQGASDLLFEFFNR